MTETLNTSYEDTLRLVLEKGTHKDDRTGTGTTSYFGHQMRFDLSEGFPLITTKKVHMKSIVYELLWFLKGVGNTEYLHDNNVTIWNEWEDENGDLGPVYGVVWRYSPVTSYNKMVKIRKRFDEYADYQYPFKQISQAIECDLNSEHLWAIEDLGTNGTKNRVYRVQYKSGYVTEITRPNWKTLEHSISSDRYERNTVGIGFLGEPVKASERVYNLWRNMLARCYDSNHPQFKFYGARGVTVSPIWHSFEMFVKTLSKVPLHHMWLNSDSGEYELDKDYYGANVYSPSTTIFLPKEVNKRISSDGSVLIVKGHKYSDWNHYERQEEATGDYAKSRLLGGHNYRDVTPSEVEVLQPEDGFVWRPQVYIDQIEEVIEQIKTNPDSRRLIVSAWNPGLLPFQALPPCHAFFQFYVADGKLSLQLYQRSADLFLGVPFNIASYALLLHMVAQQTGFEVGEFIWTGGDCHIYDNHLEQVNEQLSRKPYPFPTLKLRKRDSIFDYEYDDVQIEGYESHPTIKGAVAV